MANLALILGDQLSLSVSSLQGYDRATDYVLMCEVDAEATYVRHHKKKIAFVFSAMRHFAALLRQQGYSVLYTRLDAPDNAGSLREEVRKQFKHKQFDRVIVTAPGEYRLLEEMRGWEKDFGLPVEIRENDLFLCSPEQFARWARGRKQLRMEYFYRDMRKMYGILMEGEEPVGGQWNYDAENRKPPKEGLRVPPPCETEVDAITKEVLLLVERVFPDHFGDLEPFSFAVTREQALAVLVRFIKERLAHFGDYQDAMIQGESWMYHSHISFYLNCGLLHPLECVKAAEKAFRQGKAPLNAVEGFIRQIIGWREYIRGIYWLKMPAYRDENFLEATRALPDFYWSGQTKMNCLRCCVLETKENAYAHHIQRLMVLGNFTLLSGIDPKQVNEWFLIVYADAYEWVELPNVSGMILFADGGYLASKPYAAGGSYIHKMSDYCKKCSYQVSKKNGPQACPFNYLYWDFLDRNRDKLQSNPRIGMMYKTLDKMTPEKQTAIRTDSQKFFQQIETGEMV